jgi:nitronate monooxygenase
MKPALARAHSFCERFGLKLPILMAPMSGACPPSLAIAVANAGGLGACGALLMQPAEIKAWADELRAATKGPFQINLWIPDPPPHRDQDHEARVREFLSQWGPNVAENAGDATPPDFATQCEALLEVAPPILSSVMGLYPADFIRRMKDRGIAYFANVSTAKEAKLSEAAGADVVVAQGMEAGGHRGCFNADDAESTMVGLFSLLPAIVDAVKIPVVATGGIADERGVAAALTLGASAAQVGTAFLVCPEAQLNPAWRDGLLNAAPEDTVVTRTFSGRAGRSLRTDYTRAAMRADAPWPAPYPVQRGLTAAMRKEAAGNGDLQRMQCWAGQSARLSRVEPADEVVQRLWTVAQEMLR